MNIENIKKAIEADAGEKLPDLEKSLKESKTGQYERTYTPEQILIRDARKRLNLSQQGFSNLINTPVATLRDWEQGRYPPPGVMLKLAEIALHHPEVFDNVA
ncbi:MAG: XRE family transcriptional regulator [Gammaproteobacteria bacterium]|nr:MAG: XRE family transcriptional regulator [Gammaproteobacteria bacterium]